MPAPVRSARGYTLVELLVVVGLIAAALAVGAAAMRSGMPGAQLRGAARELAAQLRYTRAQAIVTGTPQVFTLDARTREWQAPNRRHGTIPREIAVVATGAKIEQQHPDEVAIRFFPEGAATGGRIVLKRGDAAWRLDVEWLTGQVDLQRGAGAP
jgi:general secretion pathway protein H